jgi:hypothetical protein
MPAPTSVTVAAAHMVCVPVGPTPPRPAGRTDHEYR